MNTDMIPFEDEMDWLYTTTRRLALDNDTRRGFVVKGDDNHVLESIAVMITNARSLHSHKQPADQSKPQHAEQVDWCESFDGKKTSTRGQICNQCPAFRDCRWKIELTVSFVDDPDPYLLTIPTTSAIRFKESAARLLRVTGKRVEDVLWHAAVRVEKNDRDEKFPIAVFTPVERETGQVIDLTPKPQPEPVAVGMLPLDPVANGRKKPRA